MHDHKRLTCFAENCIIPGHKTFQHLCIGLLPYVACVKMVRPQYTANQRSFLVTEYLQTKSVRTVLERFQHEFPNVRFRAASLSSAMSTSTVILGPATISTRGGPANEGRNAHRPTLQQSGPSSTRNMLEKQGSKLSAAAEMVSACPRPHLIASHVWTCDTTLTK